MNYLQISGIVGGNFDLGKIDTYIHLREDNGVEPFHQFGLELDVMEVRFDYMSTSVLMGRVSHLLLKVSAVIYNSQYNICSILISFDNSLTLIGLRGDTSLLVLFGSDFVNWIFIKNFQKNLEVKIDINRVNLTPFSNY